LDVAKAADKKDVVTFLSTISGGGEQQSVAASTSKPEEREDETPTQQADQSDAKGAKPGLTTGFMTKQSKFHKSWKRRFFIS